MRAAGFLRRTWSDQICGCEIYGQRCDIDALIEILGNLQKEEEELEESEESESELEEAGEEVGEECYYRGGKLVHLVEEEEERLHMRWEGRFQSGRGAR